MRDRRLVGRRSAGHRGHGAVLVRTELVQQQQLAQSHLQFLHHGRLAAERDENEHTLQRVEQREEIPKVDLLEVGRQEAGHPGEAHQQEQAQVEIEIEFAGGRAEKLQLVAVGGEQQALGGEQKEGQV